MRILVLARVSVSVVYSVAGEEATVVGSAAGLDPRDMVSSSKCRTQAAPGSADCLAECRRHYQAPTCELKHQACVLILCCCFNLAFLMQVFTQYREHGVLLWRGFSFDDFANQVSTHRLSVSCKRSAAGIYANTAAVLIKDCSNPKLQSVSACLVVASPTASPS